MSKAFFKLAVQQEFPFEMHIVVDRDPCSPWTAFGYSLLLICGLVPICVIGISEVTFGMIQLETPRRLASDCMDKYGAIFLWVKESVQEKVDDAWEWVRGASGE